MAVELAAGYISLVPSAKGLGRNLARELGGPLEAAGRDAGDRSASAFGSRFSAGLARTAKQAGVALGVAFGAAGTYGVKVAADFQQTRIAFEGILGSADEATKRLGELQKFAAGTPFEFKGLAESAQNLLAVGFAADDIIPTMTTLGNVAATLGVGEQEIKGVVRALGQMKGKGKASAEELQQISEQVPGFSAIQAIADDMGVSVAKAFEKVAAGAVPADRAISAILAGMEAFPGAAGAMERQSKTLNGVLSTFKDTINIALIEGIEPFLPAMSNALSGAIPIIETFITGTVDGIATVVSGFGTLTGAVGSFFTEINQGNVAGGIAVEIGKLVGLAEDHPIVSALATALQAVGDGGRAAFDALSGVVGFVTTEVSAAVDVSKEAWRLYAQEGVGPVADAFDRIQGVMGDITEALAQQRDILIPAAAAAASFATALLVFTQVSRTMTAITVAAQAVSVAIAAIGAVLAGSVVAIAIAAVAAIAGAFVAAYFTIQPFRDAVDGLIDTIGEIATAVGRFASEIFDKALPVLKDFVGNVVDLARSIAQGFTRGHRAFGGVIERNLIRPLRPLGRFITEEIAPAFSAFGDFVSALFARIADVVGPAVTILRAEFGFLAGVLSDVVGPAFNTLAAQATAAFNIVRTIVETIANVLAPALGLAFDALAGVIDIAWGVIVGVIQFAFDTIEGIFDVFTGLLTGDFGKVWEGLTEIVGAPFRAIRDIVVNTFEEVIEFVGGVPGRIGDFVTAIFGGAVDIATTIFDGIKDVVTTTFEGIVDFVTELPGRIGEAASGMWDGISDAFAAAVNFIIRGWNSLEFTIPGFDPPGPGPKFGGFTLGLPQIDELALGGIVRATPGGSIIRAGEAGRDEAVVPLPPGFDIADIAGGGGALVGGDLNVLQMPGEDTAMTAMRELKRLQMLVA